MVFLTVAEVISLESEFTPVESKSKIKEALNEEKKEEDNKRLPSLSSATLATLQRLQSPESSTESDEICKIFRDKNNLNVNQKIHEIDQVNNSHCIKNNINCECSEEDCSFVYYEEDSGDRSVSICEEYDDDNIDHQNSKTLFNEISFSNCEFDVETFHQFLKESNDKSNHDCCDNSENSEEDDEKSDESDFFCDCLVEAVPLYHQTTTTTISTDKNIIMRETGASKLRGLLKPANRPPPVRKNRVVFDETRNEFFEADYIILIREDCPYDEEDEEPCTCGDHELVRICCDEGCNCGYTDVDDGRTPPVSLKLFSFLFFQLFIQIQ